LEQDGNLPPVILPQLIRSHNKKESCITLRNGSEILYGGMDQRGTDGEAWFNSLDFGTIAVDQAEELTEDEYSLLGGRLRHPSQPVQQAILACNPKGKSHWLYRRFFIEKARERVLIRSKTKDNIFLPKPYLARLSRFTGPYYQRFVEGEWVDMEGLVYGNFDPLLHIIDRKPIPSGWALFWSVDFGYAQPYCAQLWAIKGDYPIDWDKPKLPVDIPKGSMLLAREIYYSHRTGDLHADRMVRIAAPNLVESTVCDWDAEGRSFLEKVGYGTECAFKEIEVGIQAMMLRIGNYTSPNDGKYVVPTLYIMDGALDELDERLQTDPATGKRRNVPVCTSDEFGFYGWPTDRAGNPKKTEVPADEFNHGMDTARYAVVRTDGYGSDGWIG